MKKLALVRVLQCFLVLTSVATAGALPDDATFSAEGPNYVAEAVGSGDTEADAQNAALKTAIDVIMTSLGKDTLFAELFFKNPPVTMTWKKLSSEKGLAAWTVRLKLVVDDESLRLLYNSSYVATVSTMLDGAETRLSDAERIAAEARNAETEGQLGRAMSLYWQARDACDSGLDLLAPIGDAAVFSTYGKKKAPELRNVLGVVRQTVVSGYDRIKAAEKGLAADEELASVLASLVDLETLVSETEKWAGGISSQAARIEDTPKAELKAFSDELGVRQRTLSDAKLALGRMEETVPKSKEIVRARMDVVSRRIDSTSGYIGKTKSTVDREIRNPAINRAKRAQSIRWLLLHEPSGALSLRFYTPFGLDPSSTDIAFMDTGRLEFGLRAEGAFGSENGVWIATSLKKDDILVTALDSEGSNLKNTGYTQTIDLAFYGRGFFGIGASWDWLRKLDDVNVEKRLAMRAMLGGMQESRDRLGWLAAISWEVPYDLGTGNFEAANVFNAGLDALLRLGTAVELNGALALRPRESGVDVYDTTLRYAVGAGIRLPKPFMWGIEFGGQTASILGQQSPVPFSASHIRFFMEYSL